MSAQISPGSGWIRYQLPGPLGSALNRYLPRAGWIHRQFGTDDAFRTEESNRHQTPTFMTARLIRDTGPEAFEHLGSLPGEETDLTAVIHGQLTNAGQFEKLNKEEGLPARVAEFQLRFQTTAKQDLAEAMRTFFIERALPRLPQSKLLIVDMDQELVSRYTLVRMLVSVENDPAALTGPGLRAAQALATSGIYGAEPLLAPALNILAPYVYAVPSARARAAGVWVFGESVPGAAWPSNQLLDALKITAERFTGKRLRTGQDKPTATAEQMAAFLTWWTGRVNELLAVATDPARFPGGSGSYDPGRHWQFLASIERLFRDVGEAMHFAERNETARLRAAYDALDTLEGMRLAGDFNACMNPANARKALDYLTQHLPADVAAVALPVCQRGLDALAEVRAQFLPGRYNGPTGLVGLPGKKGPVNYGWDQAVSTYLRKDRNGAHSYMSFDPDEKAVLLSHTGNLPYGLANVAVLWLLKVLADQRQLLATLPIA